MFRVYDKTKKEWIEDNVLLAPNGDLYIVKKNIFGEKLELTSPERYIYHRDINLYDKHHVLIYEGDIVNAQVSEDRVVNGMVAYARELSSYVILCSKYDEFFTLGSEVCEYVEVVGNVFDNQEED